MPTDIVTEITSHWQGYALVLTAIAGLIGLISSKLIPALTKSYTVWSEHNQKARAANLEIKEREMALKVMEDTPDSSQAEKAFRFVIRKLERDVRLFRLESEEARQAHLQCVSDRAQDAAEISMMKIKLNTAEANLIKANDELSELRSEVDRIRILGNIPPDEDLSNG